MICIQYYISHIYIYHGIYMNILNIMNIIRYTYIHDLMSIIHDAYIMIYHDINEYY